MTQTPIRSAKSLRLRNRELARPRPDVSVIITALNAEAYLREALESIFTQRTSAACEILLVDDGSTDGTVALATSLVHNSPHTLDILQHPGRKNRGISASRNLALEHARAPVTAFLDADDVWLPDRLAHQLPYLRSHPSVAMVYAQAERWLDFSLPFSPTIGSLGENFTPALLPAGQTGGFISSPGLLAWFLADESMTPCTCTVLVRTEIARQLGGFVHSFTGIYDDQVFYSKLALAHPIFVSEEVVARYRQHAGSCCAAARRAHIGDHGRKLFLSWLKQYRKAFPQSPSLPQELTAELEAAFVS